MATPQRFIPLVITASGDTVAVEFNKTLDRMDGRLTAFNNKFKDSFKNSGFNRSDLESFKNIPPDVFRAARTSDVHAREFRAMEREAARAAREVQRINAETTRQTAAQSRLREQIDRRTADAQVREATRAGKQSADAFLRSLKTMEAGSEATARASSSLFDKYLSAAFFGALAARAARAFYDGARDFITGGVQLAQEAQKGIISASAKASQFGISDEDTKRTVNNLKLVRLGMVQAGDAAVGYRNLLARFTPEQSINLLERFADSLAFGKREAISYSEALKAGTQGLKNLESATVDNLGFGKNLSTIMKEQKLKLEDLDDAQKRGKATLALYNGVLKETAVDLGNAERWSGTYSGAVARQELAERNLQKAIGEFIIQSPTHIEALKIVTEQINGYTDATGDANSETRKFAKDALDAYDKLRVGLIPVAGGFAKFVHLISQGLGVIATAVVGTVLRIIEEVTLGAEKLVVVALNSVIRLINELEAIVDKAGLKGVIGVGGQVEYFKEPERRNLGSDFFFNETKKAYNEMVAAGKAIHGLSVEWHKAVDRLNAVAADAKRAGVRPDDAGLARARELAGQAGGGRTAEAAAEKAARAKRIIDDSEKFNLSELKEIEAFFKAATGRTLPVSAYGQSGYHNKIKLDHRNAADVAINPNSPEGRLLTQYLDRNEIPYRAFTGPYRRSDGVLTATGAHVHIGAPSHGFGKNVESLARSGNRDESVTIALGGEAVRLSPEKLYGLQTRLEEMRRAAANAPLETAAGPLAGTLTPRLTTDAAARVETGKELDRQYQELYDRQKNFAWELENIWTRAAINRAHREMDMCAQIEQAESDLADLRHEAADDQLSEMRRLLKAKGEEVELTRRLIDLGDEYANAGVNAALRQQVAAMEEVVSIRRADVEALEQQARAQVRLADATVLHGEQVRARVLDHLASQSSVTDAWAEGLISSYDQVASFIDRGIEKLTKGVGLLDSLLKSVVRSLLSRVWQQFLNALFPSGQTQQSPGFGGIFGGGQQQQSSGGGGGLLGRIFGGGGQGGGLFGGGGTPPFVGGSGGGFNLLSLLGATGGANPSNPLARQLSLLALDDALPATLTQQLAGAGPLQLAGGGGRQGILGALLGGAGGGSFLGSLAGTGGLMAPLLGLQIGVGLGGPSTLGRILGGVGGGLLGALGFGAAAMTGVFGMGSALTGLGGAIFGLAPILGPLAALAIPAAIILGKNAARRRDERSRDKFTGDALKQLDELIRQVRDPGRPLDGAQALQQATQIREQYVQQAEALKDKKTRNIALKDVYRLDLKIAQLRGAADQQLRERALDEKLVPEFAGGLERGPVGGVLAMRRVRDDQMREMELIKVKAGERYLPPHEQARLLARGGLIPGLDRGVDDTLMWAERGALILNKAQQREPAQFGTGGIVGKPARVSQPATAQRTPEGGGGVVAGRAQPSGQQQGQGDVHFHVDEMLIDVDEGKIVSRGLRTPAGRRAFWHVNKIGLKQGKDRD